MSMSVEPMDVLSSQPSSRLVGRAGVRVINDVLALARRAGHFCDNVAELERIRVDVETLVEALPSMRDRAELYGLFDFVFGRVARRHESMRWVQVPGCRHCLS